jgi:bifunctional ADP-heptose synthase (sugar kinase/adenylyltransferase)
MLTDATLEDILRRIPRLTIGVLGDLFLDRYLDIDASLTEPSLETGLDAYQVTRVRSCPGAAGTVLNNLVALGVYEPFPISVTGDDGEGYELLMALEPLGVDCGGLLKVEGRRTPTYTKPLLYQQGQAPRELNRIDIKNRAPLPQSAEDGVLEYLDAVWPRMSALLVLDQVSEAGCGVITARIRQRLAELGNTEPDKLILADSRERIGLFRSVSLKPNITECRQAVYGSAQGPEDGRQPALELARRAGRPVFCTLGSQGILLADPRQPEGSVTHLPAYPVAGPIDPVGAGDSSSAAIASAVAAGATLEDAAAFGNLVASITIQQIGTTGTASPAQVRQRWREVADKGLA